MAVKVGINGFGRIGRQLIKIFEHDYHNTLELVAINSLRPPSALIQLLKHDSTYGSYNAVVDSIPDHIVINNKPIRTLSGTDPSQIPWAEVGVDIVLEATGKFVQSTQCRKHLTSGAKKVIITAPSKDPVDITIVYGVNHALYNPSLHHVISGASCTTNCAAPIAKVLNEHFGIISGFISTTHSYTSSQKLLDQQHKGLRDSRASAVNIIPASTGVSKALEEVLPELKGKLGAISYRIPLADVSVLEFKVVVQREHVTPDEVNTALRTAAGSSLKGILEVTSEELVSSDFIGSVVSATIDAPQTSTIGNNMVRVVAWYDNEWGYCQRIANLAAYIATQGF